MNQNNAVIESAEVDTVVILEDAPAVSVKKSAIPRRQRGATVLELALWSGGALLVIALAAYGFLKFSENNRTAATQQQLLDLSSSVRQLYPDPNFAGLTVTQIKDSGKAPGGMLSGDNLVNKWGGLVTVAPSSINSGNNNAFAIGFPQVPRSECNSLVAGLQQNFVAITVNSTTVKDPVTPLVSATVTTACNTTNNLITFTATS